MKHQYDIQWRYNKWIGWYNFNKIILEGKNKKIDWMLFGGSRCLRSSMIGRLGRKRIGNVRRNSMIEFMLRFKEIIRMLVISEEFMISRRCLIAKVIKPVLMIYSPDIKSAQEESHEIEWGHNQTTTIPRQINVMKQHKKINKVTR